MDPMSEYLARAMIEARIAARAHAVRGSRSRRQTRRAPPTSSASR